MSDSEEEVFLTLTRSSFGSSFRPPPRQIFVSVVQRVTLQTQTLEMLSQIKGSIISVHKLPRSALHITMYEKII